jgi:chaperonin GroEL
MSESTKMILFEDEARQALKAGVDVVADAVKTTLGPRGRNVALDRKPHSPLVTHDGVTVAKNIELFDPFENMGVQLVKAAALKVNDTTGDGTTTATVLAQAIVAEGTHAMAAGANPMLIKRGLDQGVAFVASYLRESARPLQGADDIGRVATIAAADEEIGRLIGELMDQVGRDGVVTVEETPALGVSTEFREGLEYDKGWISQHLVTDQGRQECVIEDTLVFLTGKKIEKVGQIVPLLERLVDAGEKNLFIIAEDIESEALSTLVLTKLHGKLNIVATKAPAYGDRRKLELDDIAALTGATVIGEDSGVRLETITLKELGRAARVVSGKERTTISGGSGSDTSIQERMRTLRSMLADDFMPEFDREWIEKRLARLNNGIGIIRVGASTKAEAEERKMRIEDALGATRAAVLEGILPGGGVALLNAAQALTALHLPGDQGVGVSVLRRALEEPIRLLAENAGYSGPVVVGTVRRRQVETGNWNVGFNVFDGTYVDLYEAGIIDPLRVVRTALENAASVATLVLTCEALVSDWPDPAIKRIPSIMERSTWSKRY